MPLYEYRCPKCGNFEQLESMNSETTKQCPKCQGVANRIISTPSPPVFKGKPFSASSHKKPKN